MTPLQVGAAPGAILTIQLPTYNAGSNFTADAFPGLQINVVIGVAGQRVITQSTFGGQQSGDGITVGGVASNFLPTNRIVGGFTSASLALNSTGVTSSNWQSPMVMVELQLDCGIVRKQIPVGFDTQNDVLFAAAGLLP